VNARLEAMNEKLEFTHRELPAKIKAATKVS
jgi:tetrahydromethanopterin S-methyltransferase subunit G